MERTAPRLALPASLGLFVAFSVLLALACLGTELVAAFALHLPNPYNWPLTPYHEMTWDLHAFQHRFEHFHQADFFEMEPERAFAYPAPMALIYWLLYRIPYDPLTNLFLALLVAALIVPALLIGRALWRRGLSARAATIFCGSAVLLSYPFAFEAKQGNLELFVFLLVAGGVWLHLRGRGYGAAACFGVAGSLKLFPLIFLGLLIAQRRWRPVLFGLVIAGVVMVASLWLLVPDIPFAWRHIQDGIGLFTEKITLEVIPREIGFDHSLFSVVKRAWRIVFPGSSLRPVMNAYLLVAAASGIAVFFLRIRRMPMVNQVLTLSVCAVLLPQASYDYTLIHLYAPLALLAFAAVEAARRGESLPGIRAACILLAVSLAPLSELIVNGSRFGGQVRALALAALLAVALLRRFPSHFDFIPA